jgi:hypothetical protein
VHERAQERLADDSGRAGGDDAQEVAVAGIGASAGGGF